MAIVGAGFGGLFAAKALRQADLDVKVIDRVRVSGLAGWVIWLVVHVFGLTGFKNRVAVPSSAAAARNAPSPLSTQLALEASEAAGAQGRF